MTQPHEPPCARCGKPILWPDHGWRRVGNGDDRVHVPHCPRKL